MISTNRSKTLVKQKRIEDVIGKREKSTAGQTSVGENRDDDDIDPAVLCF